MIDINEYKRHVRSWLDQNTAASEAEFIDYCEALIPTREYSSYKWLIDETLSWYQSILEGRKHHELEEDD